MMMQERSMKRAAKTVFIILVIFLVFYSYLLAIEDGEREPGMFSKENPYKTGIIFNVSSILLEAESYQGGIGIKRYFKEDWAYRAAIDFGYSSSSNSWLVSFGNTFEYHVSSGNISPYVGFFFDIGYATYKDETDSQNWTKVWSVPFSTGPLLGVEIKIFNVLSLFVEYGIAFDLVYTSTTNSVNGIETDESTQSYGVNTGMGNDSKIGIVIYFNREFKRNRD